MVGKRELAYAAECHPETCSPPSFLKPGSLLVSCRRHSPAFSAEFTSIQRRSRLFSRFGRARCARICRRPETVINKAEAGRILGVTDKTVGHRLSLFETSYQIVRTQAHHVPSTRRLVRRPKWLFDDSGQGLHLQAICPVHSGETINSSMPAIAGAPSRWFASNPRCNTLVEFSWGSFLKDPVFLAVSGHDAVGSGSDQMGEIDAFCKSERWRVADRSGALMSGSGQHQPFP